MRCAVREYAVCITDAKCIALVAVISQVVHEIYLKLINP
jgi:hypothetical protein